MNHDYADIRNKIDESPRWFDERAVPRYVDFAPAHLANIYASECVLMEIRCQACHRSFEVAMSYAPSDDIREPPRGPLSLRVPFLHYGDPPNVGCCAMGLSMNSEPQRVLQFWRTENWEWRRVPELEISIEADWAH